MQDRDECSDEISLLDYIKIFAGHKKLIIAIIVISVVGTGIFSFLSPKIYVATAVIIPADNRQDQRGMSALSSQLGIAALQPSNAAEIVSLLQSNILMERVINKYDLMPVFFGKEAKERNIWDGIRYLKNGIYKVNDNKRDGVIELSVEFKDPDVSAHTLTYILTELTDYMSGEAKRVAETNRTYLESLIEKNADPLIKQNIYSLIARQIEISMMAEVKENFAFKVLDPPRASDRKIKPKIRENIMFSFIVSLFAGIGLTFFIEYLKKLKKLRQQETQEVIE